MRKKEVVEYEIIENLKKYVLGPFSVTTIPYMVLSVRIYGEKCEYDLGTPSGSAYVFIHFNCSK